jgi:CBS domain-containing protein
MLPCVPLVNHRLVRHTLAMRSSVTHVLPTPSSSLLHQLSQELVQHPPFAQMQRAHVQDFVQQAQQRYYAPGDAVVVPEDGPLQTLFYVRSGAITGTQGLPGTTGNAFLYEAGDMFPVAAVVAQRPVSALYTASADSFVLALPVAAMHALAASSTVFADFLSRRIQSFLSLSRQALQDAYASRVLAEQSLETPLGELMRRAPITCVLSTPLRAALGTMQRERIGSILVTQESGALQGILTRQDVLERITLPGVSLDLPISQVMASPVHTLSRAHTAHDAALLMSRWGIRHVPITQDEVAVGIVSERDLFAMQRLSLQQLSSALRLASSVDALKNLAPDIGRFAQRLLAQGIQARQLTGLISHLNDLLTQRLLDLLAVQHRLSAQQACWIALGSEGRDEQTIATDQDNALVLQDDCGEATRARWLAFALEANTALDACGFPLCKGHIMASNPELCLTQRQWQARFDHWIEHGAPEDLLRASIFFDLRALWGPLPLAQSLRHSVLSRTPHAPRFLMQMAVNALSRSVPLTWTGAIDTDKDGLLNLKLRGTTIFVDAARLYALAHGIHENNTRARLAAMGAKLGVAASEYEGWIGGFEFLQTLRLRIQMDGAPHADAANSIAISSLNTIDRRILKETFSVANALQKRMRMDYTL